MILGKRNRSLDAAKFAEGLMRASRGVVRVTLLAQDRQTGFTTGWLVTDTLVALVADASTGPTALCSFAPEPDLVVRGEFVKVAAATAENQGPALLQLGDYNDLQPIRSRTAENPGPALLRLDRPFPDRVLTFGVEAPKPDDQVFLLHHPLGEPRQCLSIGRLTAVEGSWLRYDADTQPGSTGCPVFDQAWSVIGMHFRTSASYSSEPHYNEGLSLAKVLQKLHASPAWGEVARHHKLANVAAALEALESRPETPAPVAPGNALVGAAVRWRFDPEALRQLDAEEVRPLVIDPSARFWALRAPERQRVLRAAGSLDLLRKARGQEEAADPGQRAIDRILAGPPYALKEVPEAELPYWLQAVRWFSEVAPGLPKPAEVNRELERKRVRGRLRDLMGDRFRGRATELAMLQAWYDDSAAGPMVVSGIGGVGKSALVARFAAGVPDDTLLLWLDFDRADLAPDDAVSVLSLLNAQVGVQREEFVAPAVTAVDWETAASACGAELARVTAGTSPPLLVLDGFEVAQHVRRHDEIWGLLERVRAGAPALRILVSGRAPVLGLKLGGRPSRSLHLNGMAPEDAETWLRECHVSDDAVLGQVLELSGCVPLKLKLAIRLIEAGGDVGNLPRDLPQALVEGFLYERILDRVIDPALKPVARGALVLRRLTAAMTAEVLGDVVPEGHDAQEVYERLAREMAIVAGDDAGQGGGPSSVPTTTAPEVLRLRPEVRSATLKLLERDDAANVTKIDERAAAWYARQDLDLVVNAAELVYHRLRLGDLAAAERAWRDGCAPLLLYAVDELPLEAKAARRWLHKRTGHGSRVSRDLEAWEKDAADRIRIALARGLFRAVPNILAERAAQSPDRSPASSLAVYDAWMRSKAGDLAGARDLLADAGHAEGQAGRDRAVLGALLAARAGDLRGADRLLKPLDDDGPWRERPEGELEALAVRAARVWLTVDVDAELSLTAALKRGSDVDRSELDRILTVMDATLPELSRTLATIWAIESPANLIQIPSRDPDLRSFALAVERERLKELVNPYPFVAGLRVLEPVPTEPEGPWELDDLDIDPLTKAAIRESDVLRLGIRLAVLGWRRWRLATSTLFLKQVCEEALRPYKLADLLNLSVIRTLAAFNVDLSAPVRLWYKSKGLDEIFTWALRTKGGAEPATSVGRLGLLARALELEAGPSPTTRRINDWLADRTAGGEMSEYDVVPNPVLDELLREVESLHQQKLCVVILGPAPLETLARRTLGLPENVSL